MKMNKKDLETEKGRLKILNRLFKTSKQREGIYHWHILTHYSHVFYFTRLFKFITPCQQVNINKHGVIMFSYHSYMTSFDFVTKKLLK